MATLDTNVLIRYLVGDDKKQLHLARSYIERASTIGEYLFVPLSVLVEMEWVLRSRYGFKKNEFIRTLNSLLDTQEILFQEEASVESALFLYSENSADFADCLHVASAITNDQQPMITFDKKAAKLVSTVLLSE